MFQPPGMKPIRTVVKCVGDCIAIYPLPKARVAGALHVAPADDPNMDTRLGWVISAGPGLLKTDDTFEPMPCKEGDIVIVGQVLWFYPDGLSGPKCTLTPARAVMAILEPSEYLLNPHVKAQPPDGILIPWDGPIKPIAGHD